MLFLDYTHWTTAMREGSFVMSMKEYMKTRQVVAVIGASGKLGSALARTLSKGNYRILLHSSKTHKVECLRNEIKSEYSSADIDIVDDYVEIGWEADAVILAVPYSAEKEVAERMKSVVNQKIIISVSNPLNDRYNGLLTSPGISAAEELQKLLPNSKVIKAFNTVLANDFKQPVIYGPQLDCFIAGNDEDALELVYDMVNTAGFHPVVAGDLSFSRTLESLQLLLFQHTIEKNYKRTAGGKLLHNGGYLAQ
jgi:8-hydroxy-5-deazaflavin:NADPH oxidoreductase